MTATDPVPALREVLGDDNQENLALRFRALFSLKHLARNGSKPAIGAIANAFSSKSGFLTLILFSSPPILTYSISQPS